MAELTHEQKAERDAMLEIFGGAYNAFYGRVLPLLKKNSDKVEKGQFRSLKEPFNPIYNQSVEQLYRIKPHSSTEYYPADLFAHLSPHRKQEEADWIRNNYEPVTLPVWMDFQSTLKRGTNPNNYKVVWSDEMPSEYDGEKDPRVYVNRDLKLYGSTHNWFSNVLFDVKLKDANGVVAVQPFKLAMEEDEDGVKYIPSESMIEPIPIYYSSAQVMSFEEDEYYLLMSKEQVTLSDKHNAKKGFVFYFFDKERIIKIFQVGKYSDWDFEMVEYFHHEWGSLPVWKLKGQPRMEDDHIYFQSPFDFAVGNLNLATKNQINKQMAEANGAWPHKIMIAEVCDNTGDDNQPCRGGRVWLNRVWTDEEGAEHTGMDSSCPKCKGTGYQDKPSPGSTMMVDQTQILDNGIGIDRIKFAAPDPSILNHLKETIKDNQNQARDILHIYTTNSEVTGKEDTATGENIDNNAMIAFIMPIVYEGFEIYEGVLQAIIHMRYGDSVPAPTVIKPTDFDYKRSVDYLNEYTSLLEKGAPPVVLYKVLEKYIEKMFYADGNDANVFKLILATDTVVTKKDEEIRNMVGAGTLAKWQAILHHNVFSYINELVEQDDKFFEKDISDQRQALIDLAKGAEADMTSTQTTTLDIVDAITGDRQAA